MYRSGNRRCGLGRISTSPVSAFTRLPGAFQSDIDNARESLQNLGPMRYQIDGTRFSTLEEFFDEVSRVLVQGRQWGHNLDAFNDILRGGFGTPTGGFTIYWKDHLLSRERLGYGETIRQLEMRAESCHPLSRDKILTELVAARAHQGPTVFDWLTGIIRIHGLGGSEGQDRVELI